MLDKVKKYGIIIIIAILFATFAFSIVDVVMEEPDYEDYCFIEAKPIVRDSGIKCPDFEVPEDSEVAECQAKDGRIEYSHDKDGCVESYECNLCFGEYENAQKDHRLVGFIVTGILGVIAIIVGLYVKSKSEIVEGIYSGFLIGGIISITIGTMSYFPHMGRFIRPVVLLVEIILIVLIALKTATKKK